MGNLKRSFMETTKLFSLSLPHTFISLSIHLKQLLCTIPKILEFLLHFVIFIGLNLVFPWLDTHENPFASHSILTMSCERDRCCGVSPRPSSHHPCVDMVSC